MQIANSTVLDTIFPSKAWTKVDPVLNVDSLFPPNFIVHGSADTKVPIHLNRKLFDVLKQNGVECGIVEVHREEHTFAVRMEVGSVIWNLQRQGFDFLESLIK